MRLVACSALLAGCNSIFGLNDNAKIADPTDGPVLVDGKLETFKLRYLLADTEVISPNILNEPAGLATIGIADLTSVKVGTLDGELFEAPYDATSGDVGIPLADLTAAPWRVRYTLDGVDHQVQWQPELVDAKLGEPFIGRQAVTPPPADSGYNIQPTGAGVPGIGLFTNARVFTTGAFLDMRVGASPSTTTIPTSTTTFFRTLGAPTPTTGDAAVLVNYKPLGACSALVDGYAHFLVPELQAGTKLPISPQPAWKRPVEITQTFSYKNLGAIVSVRLLSALGTRSRRSSTASPRASTCRGGWSIARSPLGPR